MFAESHDEENIIDRIAALDIGKAELVCCVRVPTTEGRTRTGWIRGWPTPAMSNTCPVVRKRCARCCVVEQGGRRQNQRANFVQPGPIPGPPTRHRRRGHYILVITWQQLADTNTRFEDLGADHYTCFVNPDTKKRNYIRQLEALGYTVTLTPAA
jgi:hypothetical protein